ncbi:hypothetical protein [Roseomonas elaeocarpi]|uniref:Uncharacterized protein n=1 Tax=Roseomonas elaeocarpi TaxID=907779 RepID=A0ABV6JRQ3_9PROT
MQGWQSLDEAPFETKVWILDRKLGVTIGIRTSDVSAPWVFANPNCGQAEPMGWTPLNAEREPENITRLVAGSAPP